MGWAEVWEVRGGRREDLQRGMRKLEGMIDTFIILIMVMVSHV